MVPSWIKLKAELLNILIDQVRASQGKRHRTGEYQGGYNLFKRDKGIDW
jgi:hypothetical protein